MSTCDNDNLCDGQCGREWTEQFGLIRLCDECAAAPGQIAGTCACGEAGVLRTSGRVACDGCVPSPRRASAGGTEKIDWAKGWADGTLTAADIYAAVDAMTEEEQLAEAEAFVRAAAEHDPLADPELLAEAGFGLGDLPKGEEVHLRCYVAMIRARDRSVAMAEPCGCHLFDGLVCPEHAVTCLDDDCFYCDGCGEAHGDCCCGRLDENIASRRTVIM